MKFNTPQATEDYILSLLQPGTEYTLRDITGLSGKLSYASMRVYVYGLVEQGRLEKLPYTKDRALVFTLPHSNVQGAPLFNFSGKDKPRQSMALAFKSFGMAQRPTRLMQLAPTFPNIIAKLYSLAARYSNNVQLPISDIAYVRAELLALKNECDRVSFVANQMLTTPGLWEKQNLPAMLINAIDPMSAPDAEDIAAKVADNFPVG